jgi:hypothetical protein
MSGYPVAERVLGTIWESHGARALEIAQQFAACGATSEAAAREYFFVLLGGHGVAYETNLSGLRVLEAKGCLEPARYATDEAAERTRELLARELSTPQFDPPTKDGGLRRYRYTNSKPRLLAAGGRWLFREAGWDLPKKLRGSPAGPARAWLCTAPGFGLKSASLLLRNCGLSDDVAVLDVHVLRFLARLGLPVPRSLTPKAYLVLEEDFRGVCRQVGASLGAMDLLIWTLGHQGRLREIPLD